MENPFDEKAVDHLETMMRAEEEKEITQIATTQGQIVGLIVLLRSKDLLSSEDVDKWETLSGECGEKIAGLLRATNKARQVEAEDEDMVENLESKLDLLLRSIDFGRMMGNPEEKLAKVQLMADGVEAELERVRGTDRDS